MNKPHLFRFSRGLVSLVIVFSVVSLACNLPFGLQRTPQPELLASPQPTPLPTPAESLPPVVVESHPQPNSLLPADQGVALTFDQPMDRPSVEGALRLEPATAGRFEWLDDQSVRFVPDQPFAADSRVVVTVDQSARAASGKNLLRPVSFTYRTAGALSVAERIPQPGITELDPTTVVAATFTRPVVPLGDVGAAEPVALTLDPPAEGSGRWLNTSTYVFTPQPALQGGATYTVSINPDLVGVDGMPVTNAAEMSWQFSTAAPAMIGFLPDSQDSLPLDAVFELAFNQPMNRPVTEGGLQLRDAAGSSVPGGFEWTERDTILRFKPQALLNRDAAYTLELRQAAGLGGTPLAFQFIQPYRTVGNFGILSTDPANNGELPIYGDFAAVTVQLSAPLAKGQPLNERVKLQPQVSNYYLYHDETSRSIYISGFFQSGQTYRLTLSGSLEDRWGSRLGQDAIVNFKAADYQAGLSIPILFNSGNLLYAVPGDALMPAYATNLDSLTIRRARMTTADLFRSVEQSFSLNGLALEETWQQDLDLPANASQATQIPFKGDGGGLPAGLYAFRIESPQFDTPSAAVQFMLVVSPVQLTLKESQNEVVVWAVNQADQRPVGGRLVSVFEAGSGLSLGRGETDADGVARIPLPPRERYRTLVVTLGESNDADFSVAVTTWNAGLYPWNFGINSTLDQPPVKAYGYTDRPIYQPGQTVYYRYVLRQWGDARYQPVDLKEAGIKIIGAYSPDLGNPLLETRRLPVSAYGTLQGQFTLPPDAPPGSYSIQVDDQPDSLLEFRVAAYRKPEIDLNVEFNQVEYLAGQDVQAQVAAAYFFDAPASGVRVEWSLYVRDAFANLREGYSSGPLDTFWLEPDWWMRFESPLGRFVQGGSGVTGSDGRFPLTFLKDNLAAMLESNRDQVLTLEVTLSDESGFPVSRRAQTVIHPADFAIGVRPQSWVQPAETPFTFSIATFDWQNRPAGDRALSASFDRIEWVQDFSAAAGGAVPLKEVVTAVSGADLRTDANGRAALQFTPPEAGIYRLEVRGGGTLTQVLVWVGGAGSTPWPNLPNQHLRLEAEQKAYLVGQTARVFVPNPLSPGALAWVTIERRGVLRSQVVTLSGGSQVLDIPLGEMDAPNVFVAVTLLGRNENGQPDFRQGYLELEVDPQALELDVSITPHESRFEPRQTARFDVLVKDHLGNPIQGEFSLAVVDKAVLALVDSTVKDIREAFYGAQPLGVFTSGSMAAYVGRIPLLPRGLGGGGGGAADDLPLLRSDFRDTAHWVAALETDASGRGQVEFVLPDNLTTWVATLRGVTRDTRVGEAITEIVVSKPLLIRPVTPRFLVAGDRVEIGAVVQNNTTAPIEATVRLQANGVALENPALERQAVQLPANGRQRVNWWVRVRDGGAAQMVFSVEGGGLQDASTLPGGNLPVLRYSSPQSFATGGILAEASEVLEVVSLPRSFTPTGGELRLELAPNLAGAVLAGLDVVQDYEIDISEPLLSRLLANLTVFELSREVSLAAPHLNARLQDSIRRDLDRLAQMQKSDGGWGWVPSMTSDLYLSAYGLWILDKAAANGFFVEEFDRMDANRFVTASLYTPEMAQDTAQLDQLAFAYFVLNQYQRSQPVPADLLELRARLNPWAQAMLALAIQSSQPDAAATILADLAGSAERSASGAFWQPLAEPGYGFSNAYANSAIVLMALVRVDPASPLVADAVRYLVLQRGENGWLNSHATAWVLAALSQAVRVTGELQGNYSFNATLNGAAIANGEAAGAQTFNPVRATVALSQLSANSNALCIQRSAGSGRLYYRAILDVGQPVETIQALDGGISLSRSYYLEGADCAGQACPAVESASRSTSNPVIQVRLSLTLPQDMTYLVVEDYIPAGAEIVDTSLNTTQLGSEEVQPLFVDDERLENGWGWWYFTAPRISNERIRWLGSYVPAGTYILTYRLLPLQLGEYRVLPARAYAMYFPDMQGRSAGSVFTIEE